MTKAERHKVDKGKKREKTLRIIQTETNMRQEDLLAEIGSCALKGFNRIRMRVPTSTRFARNRLHPPLR